MQWPHSFKDITDYKTAVIYIGEIYGKSIILIIDLSEEIHQTWRLSFIHHLKCISICGESDIPFHKPTICKGLIHVLAMCLIRNEIRFANKLQSINEQDDSFIKMNIILHGARIRAYRLKQICKRLLIAMKNYRLYHGCAKKIQKAWRKAIATPTYFLCKKRLFNEFNDLIKLKI